MSKLRPVLDHILFQFQDELVTSQGIKQFNERTSWGFDLRANFDVNLNSPRWVKVVAVGPDVKDPDIVAGAVVLVEALKWTEGMKFEEQEYWMTKEDHVISIREE